MSKPILTLSEFLAERAVRGEAPGYLGECEAVMEVRYSFATWSSIEQGMMLSAPREPGEVLQ